MNLDSILHPEHYTCRVIHYSLSHSILSILANNHVDTFSPNIYMSFAWVQYFSGAFLWEGLQLTQQPDSECFALLRRYSHFADKAPNDMLKLMDFRLYELGTLAHVRLITRGDPTITDTPL